MLAFAVFCLSALAQDYSKEELLGKFDPSKQSGFSKIEKKYTDKDNIYLRTEAYNAFVTMAAAAKKEGVNLRILSATRNFDYQKGIWETKWKRPHYKSWEDAEKVMDIMHYSAMPGASRHHWGTDVDFNSVDPSYFASGIGKKTYDWLCEHGAEYGFAQTYTTKKYGRTGYEEEKWHWSYMPIAKEMLKAYNATISYTDLRGFSGAEAAKTVGVFKDFVNGIDDSLKK
jgi:zinc D-Ala-D-Ala carboxypeptidase